MAADLWAGVSLMLNKIVSPETGLDSTRLAVRLRRDRLNTCKVCMVLTELILSVGRSVYLCWNSVELSEMSDILSPNSKQSYSSSERLCHYYCRQTGVLP